MLDTIPFKPAHAVRDVADRLYQTALEIYNDKKDALAAGDEAVAKQVAKGKDIMSVLCKSLRSVGRTEMNPIF